jgi:hypothetical protein
VGHTDDVFPMGFGEAVLRLMTSGGRLESAVTVEEDLASTPVMNLALKSHWMVVTWNASSFYKERQEVLWMSALVILWRTY